MSLQEEGVVGGGCRRRLPEEVAGGGRRRGLQEGAHERVSASRVPIEMWQRRRRRGADNFTLRQFGGFLLLDVGLSGDGVGIDIADGFAVIDFVGIEQDAVGWGRVIFLEQQDVSHLDVFPQRWKVFVQD